MTLQELLEKRIERVTAPGWHKDTYLKIDYLGDEVSPTVSFVSPGFQTKMFQEVGGIRLTLEEAFGTEQDWEEYNGKTAFKF
jgi:hypothetical protein